MIDPLHLLNYVIRPVLRDLELWSFEAERLVLGTACAESDCGRWLRQKGDGPAVGVYQMEHATHQDLWLNFLRFREPLKVKVIKWRTQTDEDTIAASEEMAGNLYYATAMCRVHYLRDPEPLPSTLDGQAAYYKRVYNTHLGKGSAEQYIRKWRQFVTS